MGFFFAFRQALFFLFKDNVKSLHGSQEYVTSWSLGDLEERIVLSSFSQGKKAFVHLEGCQQQTSENMNILDKEVFVTLWGGVQMSIVLV